MKTLYLLRHAKSSWDNPDRSDFDRPLNDRGYSEAHILGNYLRKTKFKVDRMISSPAIRANTTSIIIAQHIHYSLDDILIRTQLYDSAVTEYLDCIASVETGDSILLTGHNNSITEVAQLLTLNRINELKTCTFVGLRFNINSWKNIGSSKGDLILELHPSSIEGL